MEFGQRKQKKNFVFLVLFSNCIKVGKLLPLGSFLPLFVILNSFLPKLFCLNWQSQLTKSLGKFLV
ncbi:hypothetical protein PpSQ1_26905, partial [Pseudomonas putida]